MQPSGKAPTKASSVSGAAGHWLHSHSHVTSQDVARKRIGSARDLVVQGSDGEDGGPGAASTSQGGAAERGPQQQQQQQQGGAGGGPGAFRPACSLVWAPIPLLTWLLPCCGHIGVTSSTGIAFEVAGPYTVNEDMFGPPARWLQLDPHCASMLVQPEGGASTPKGWQGPGDTSAACINSAWDRYLRITASIHRTRDASLLAQSCHQLASDFCNSIEYNARRDMNPMRLAALVAWKGRFTTWGAALHTWGPTLLLLGSGWLLAGWLFLLAYLGLAGPLLAWFCYHSYFCLQRPRDALPVFSNVGPAALLSDSL